MTIETEARVSTIVSPFINGNFGIFQGLPRQRIASKLIDFSIASKNPPKFWPGSVPTELSLSTHFTVVVFNGQQMIFFSFNLQLSSIVRRILFCVLVRDAICDKSSLAHKMTASIFRFFSLCPLNSI